MNVCRNCGTSFDGDVCPVCKTEYKGTAIYPECCKDTESGAICYNRVQSQEDPAEVTLSSSYDSNETDDILTCGLNFELQRDGYIVTGIGECKAKDIFIPPRYNNINVVGIAENAFKDCTQLVNVEISGCVKSIGVSAFEGCTSLLSVTIGSNIKSIGTYAFRDCTSLEEIYFNAVAMDDILSKDGIYYGVFCNAGLNGKGITITVGKNVTKIPSNLCSANDDRRPIYLSMKSRERTELLEPKITRMVFEDGSRCSSIGAFSFYGCKYLTNIIIPSSVTSIGDGAFAMCISVTEVYFNSEAMNDISDDFDLFGDVGMGTSGIIVTIGSKVTKIPAYLFAFSLAEIVSVVFEDIRNCKEIHSSAFWGCNSIKSLYISDISSWCAVKYVWDETGYDYGICAGKRVKSAPYLLSYGKQIYLNGELVTDLVIPEGVTRIEDFAFYGCSSLTSVSLPGSVSYIGESAFNGCSGLKNISIPSAVTFIGERAFAECVSFTDIFISDNVMEIGDLAFYGCSKLRSVTIGRGVTLLGRSVFANCMNLMEICNLSFLDIKDEDYEQMAEQYKNERIPNYARSFTIPGPEKRPDPSWLNHYPLTVCTDDNKRGRFYLTDDGYRFYECEKACYLIRYCGNSTNLVLPSFSKKYVICHSAFGNCSFIESVTIPNVVTEIRSCAFNYCRALKDITIPSSIKYIGSDAFEGCKNLEKVYITDIAAWCSIEFKGYTSNPLHNGACLYFNDRPLESLNIPVDVTVIPRFAFFGCTSITSLTLSSNITEIQEFAFCQCPLLTSAAISNSVNSIGAHAFCNCVALKSVTLGKNIKKIAWRAFCCCSSLEEINIPDGVTQIENDTFRYCRSLTKVSIGDGVVSIGIDSFSECVSLASIEIPDNVTEIKSGAFADCTSLRSVTLGKGLKNIQGEIWDHAFGSSYSSNTVLIEKSAFSGCYKLIEICNFSSLDMPGVDALEYGEVGYNAKNVCRNEAEKGAFFKTPKGFEFYKHEDNYYLIGYSGTESDLVLLDNINGKNYEIQNGAFLNCGLLTSIVISDAVTRIGRYAFRNCMSLSKVTIGKNIKGIGRGVFYGCKALEDINISAVNLEELSDEYEKLMIGPIGGEYFFKDAGVHGISLRIDEGVERISQSYLFLRTKIKTVVIPNSILSIGKDVFSNTSISSACYYGNSTEWSKISIEDGNAPLLSAKRFYYSETKPSEDINYWHYENDKIILFESATEQYETGKKYYNGDGVKKDYSMAVSWYTKAAEQGLCEAQNTLAECYYFGRGVVQNYSEAATWYRKAAEQGKASAQHNLGVCYRDGLGVQQSHSDAVIWFKKAAEQGLCESQLNLGNSFHRGNGVVQNYSEAIVWYRKAAEQGYAGAQYNLALCYENGQGVEQDYTEAVKWYRMAAEQGDAQAQSNLGECYHYGKGVEEDDVEAVKWYRRAAELGSVKAQSNLGECYYYGQGIEEDVVEAVKWYRMAAEQGDADAQYSLGWCYKNGEGVNQDYIEAVKWLKKSAEQGNNDAKVALKDIKENP